MAIIRKKTGNFLEDFRVGGTLRHKVGKTVTEGLFNTFTEFSMTTNPLHKNRRYAQAYGYRDMILPPGLAMAIVFSQSVEDITENARVNLEYVDMRFGVPVYIGDTLEVESLVLGVSPSTADFVKQVAISDMFEIEASKLAQQKGNAAEKAFAALAETDAPAKVMLTRCREFLKTPPPQGWNGVIALTEK